jgi:ribonucleotide reductase alpha subunit
LVRPPLLFWFIQLDVQSISDLVIESLPFDPDSKGIDNLCEETVAYLAYSDPQYESLAGRLSVLNLRKTTPDKFSDAVELMHGYVNAKTKLPSPLVSDRVYNIVMANKETIDNAIVQERDYYYDYFGIKTLRRSYLLKVGDEIIERPQYMMMRVSLGIHHESIEDVIETYNLMSDRYFIHATPTLFNGGTPNAQMASCFLLDMKEDSIDGIYETLKRCAMISKGAGGIGVAVSKIRASSSYIRGTNGKSNGLVPMLKVYNDTARYVDQVF